ncbi:MAG: isochorismatase family protein [Pseudochelatococcus sp.]|jgi:nicotinamidase-related amidase|uniref:isochorismatase family protein n=1 Tax=Pseudochelatococcus sp. TaxID=2020869 RepID=UPI003D904AED
MLVARHSTLLLVDFQHRLAPVIDGAQQTIDVAGRLARVAGLVGVPVIATEQIPEKLGATSPELLPLAGQVIAKRTFDAAGEPGLPQALDLKRGQVVVTGWEAHVCVLQTALGLLRLGFRPVVAADAIGSRASFNKEIALRRLAHHGIEIVTGEMVIFEWLENADHPAFREAIALIK